MAGLFVTTAATYADGVADRDCAPDAVHVEADGRPLTREEKIARLDEALRESLARFDECQTAADGSAVEGAHGGTTGDGDGASGQPDAAEPAQTGDAVESVASGDVQGTEAPEDAESGDVDTEQPADPGEGAADIPGDIPEPDNDSVLEAQIRRAAMEETDPKIRAELWNEYRKYKGLPTRPVPDDDGEPSDAQNSK